MCKKKDAHNDSTLLFSYILVHYTRVAFIVSTLNQAQTKTGQRCRTAHFKNCKILQSYPSLFKFFMKPPLSQNYNPGRHSHLLISSNVTNTTKVPMEWKNKPPLKMTWL